MNRQYTRRVIAAFLAIVLCPAAGPETAGADETPAFSHRLPDNVAAHIEIPDAGTLRDRLAHCSWGRLLSDPLMSDFRLNIAQQIRAFIAASVPLPDGVTADDLLNLPTGELTLTMLKPVDGKLPIVFSVESAEASDTVTALVQKSVDSSIAKGWTRSSIEHARTTIIVLERAADSESDGAATRSTSANVRAIVLKDGHLVASNSVDALKQILDRWSGQVEGSFAANETLGRVQRVTIQPDRKPALFWYLDPVGAMVSLLSQRAASDPTAAVVLSRLPEFGLTSFQGVGGTIDFATGKHDTISRIAGVVNQPVKSAMAVLQFPAANLTPPDWVPDDIDNCLLLNWDTQSAYVGVEQMADGVLGPGGFANAIEGLSAKTDPPIHFRKDIVDGLTGQVVILQGKPQKPTDRNGAALLAVGLKDPTKLARIVRQLIEQPGSKAGSRTIGTTTVAVIDGAGSSTTQLAVAHGFLLVSNSTSLLDTVVRADSAERPLVNSSEYGQLISKTPQQKSLFALQRPVNQLEAAYGLLKQGGSGPGGVDLKLLPPFEKIQHYFRATATWAAPTPDGFQYVSFSLPPDKRTP